MIKGIMNDLVADMVADFLTGDILTDKVRDQIKKALEINCHLTSCYSLQVAEVLDIYGRDSKTSGWYIVLTGTRCGVRFFVNNDMEVCRKPNKNKCEVRHIYSLYNHDKFFEGFWTENF